MSRWHLFALALPLALGCSRPALPPANSDKPGQQAKGDSVPGPNSGVQPVPHTVEKTGPETGKPFVKTSKEQPGVLSGWVLWEGSPELAKEPKTPSEHTTWVGGKQVPAQLSPRLEVHQANKGVANAVVWLVKAPAEPLRSRSEPLQVSQQNGDFRPHVQAAPVGTELKMGTTDDTADFRARGAAGFTLSLPRGKHAKRPLSQAGLVELSSDAHAWQSGYVWVFDHNYFAVTDHDGRFRLPAIPPGNYEVMVWHEGWRLKEPQRLTVTHHVQKRASVKLAEGDGATILFPLLDSDVD